MTTVTSYTAGPVEPPVRELTLGGLLEEAAEHVPNRLALITGVTEPNDRRQWTYAELYQEASQGAQALLGRFEPGERVAIWAPNVAEWVIVEFAAAMAGLVLVTVNPSFQAREVEYVLNQSKSAGILVLPAYRGNQMLATVHALRDRCPMLREVIRLDEWSDFLRTRQKNGAQLPPVQADDAVMIQYTSGTTGFPKGALLHHRGLVNNGAHMMDRMELQEGCVWVAMMPLFHTGGCVLGVLGAVSIKATQVLMETFDAALALELTETYRGNALLAVPTMLIAILEHPTFTSRDLSSLVGVCSGGSTVPAALVQRFEQALGAPFTIVFGQTECSPVSSMTRPNDSTEDKATTIGGPMPHVEIKIIDPVSAVTLPVGRVGEYCARGYLIMHEYFDMPEETAATIDSEGWLHTGDLCSMDQRGYCKVEGRLKDMIIRGGENIYPREIEELLFRHPMVAEVAVVGLPDERFGEIVGAFIRDTDRDAPASDEALHHYCRKHLSAQKTPKVWCRVEAFPLTGSGKVQKFLLREQWANSPRKP